jgi:hypothetical protein
MEEFAGIAKLESGLHPHIIEFEEHRIILPNYAGDSAVS